MWRTTDARVARTLSATSLNATGERRDRTRHRGPASVSLPALDACQFIVAVWRSFARLASTVSGQCREILLSSAAHWHSGAQDDDIQSLTRHMVCQQAAAEEREKPTIIHLTVEDAARIAALSDLFPGMSAERIISDLLSTSLTQLQAEMPYEPGDKIIREDDFGDPVFEDVGLTPRFQELVKARLKSS